MGEKNDCRKNQQNIFSRYDQYVDVVSSWQEFFESVYEKESEIAKFDRFPEMPSEEENQDYITPDFSILFSDDYGIIFELKRTFPDDKKPFISTAKQLERYDTEARFETSEGEEICPERIDIVLLVGSTDYEDIEARLSKIRGEEIEIERNIILMEYTYVAEDSTPCYKFRRSKELDNFRDKGLSNRMSEFLTHDEDDPFNSSYRPIKVPVDDFVKYKAKEEIMNDSPPPIYLACFLWHNVFYQYLSDEQEIEWRRKNANKILRIPVNASKIKKDLNENYIPDYHFQKNEIIETLEFLSNSSLAKKKSDEDGYIIRYRNLRGKRTENQKTEFEDLARLIIINYCQKQQDQETAEENETKIKEEVTDEDTEQAGQTTMRNFDNTT